MTLKEHRWRAKLYHLLLLFFLYFYSCVAFALQKISIEVEEINHPALSSEGLSVALSLSSYPDVFFVINADQIKTEQLGVIRDVSIECPLNESPLPDAIRMECNNGQLKAKHHHFGQISSRVDLVYQTDASSVSVNLKELKTPAGKLNVHFEQNDRTWQIKLNGRRIKVEKLRNLIKPYYQLPEGISDESGKLSIQLTSNGKAENINTLNIALGLRNLFFNGNSVAEDLNADLNLSLKKLGKGWKIKEVLTLNSGIVYIEPGFTVGEVNPGFLLEPGNNQDGSPIRLNFSGDWSQDTIKIESLSFDDPEHLSAEINGRVKQNQNTQEDDSQEKEAIELLEIKLNTPKLEKLFPVYLQPLLFGSGLDQLELIGSGQLDLTLTKGAISDFHLVLDKVYADDEQGRFLVSDLSGDIRLNSDPKPADSRMQWQGGSIYQVNIGPGEFNLRSKGRSMWLRKKVNVPIFDGNLQIGKLIMNQLGLEDYAIHLDAGLTPITLSEFTESMGWPLMAGSISGEIPGLTYYKGDLTLDGGLSVNVFDGDIAISKLRIDDLFGLVPNLYADINIDDLDLGTLTETFEFGRITGKLEGNITDLQLQAWQPVHFDAVIQTPEDDKSQHRISQRAIDNITSIGGGGGASSIVQRGVLGFFEDFPYSKIGISCKLRNNLCYMDGVQTAKDGYYIVKRGFLPPWLDIIGFNREVDWQEMIERLKSLQSTEAPVVK